MQNMKFITRLLMSEFIIGMCLQAYRFVNCECKFSFFLSGENGKCIRRAPKQKIHWQNMIQNSFPPLGWW